MFEQSTISYGPPARRLWNTCAGLTGETLLLACAVLAPMVFPQVMPPLQAFRTALLPPVPPAPAPPDPGLRPRTRTAAQPARQIVANQLIYPVRYPAKPVVFVDPPAEIAFTAVTGGMPGSERNGVPGAFLDSILRPDARAVPTPVRPPEVRAAPVAPAPAVPQRVRGGVVDPGAPVYHPDPPYPPLARTARVSGVVELEGVIGIDGHLRELRVMSGHPLLVGAALGAVRQWVYKPTRLNGVPVEVVTRITVTFHLN
ncbi:MAG: energy transducer TonB [Acidobacteriia bacterium]|nr:energy transducer TonB [Terriglobia bacterium]